MSSSFLFKSPKNLSIEKKSANVKNFDDTINIKVDANCSISYDIAFPEPYDTIPIVLYSVICPDTKFSLNHNISTIDKTGFKICIENLLPEERNVQLQYYVKKIKTK